MQRVPSSDSQPMVGPTALPNCLYFVVWSRRLIAHIMASILTELPPTGPFVKCAKALVEE